MTTKTETEKSGLPRLKAGDYVRVINPPRGCSHPTALQTGAIFEVYEVLEGDQHCPDDMVSLCRTPGLFYAWRFEVINDEQ